MDDGGRGPLADQLLLRIDQVCQRLQLGRSFVYTLIQRNELKSVRIGAARRVLATDLEEYVRQMSAEQQDEVAVLGTAFSSSRSTTPVRGDR